jgi:two-component system CheB/CheR fusion protein
MNVRERIPKALQGKALEHVHQLSLAKTLQPYTTQRLAKDGRVLEVTLVATALIDEAGKVYAISTTERANAA